MTKITGEEIQKQWRAMTFSGITQEQHAEQLGIPYEEYKHKLYETTGRQRYAKFIEDNAGELYKPQLFKMDEYKPAEFKMNNFIAVCDVHAPCTDYSYAMLPAEIARRHLPEGERNLIVHGDVFNGDVFSRWDKIVKNPSWEQERQAANNLFAIWAKTFDTIFVMPGNHDDRILTRLDGEMSFRNVMYSMLPEQDQDLLQMFGSLFSAKLSVSQVDHCFVETSKGRYTIIHGTSYSVDALKVANEYSQRYQSHIISGHEHHIGLTMDRFGRYFLVNNGGLFDKNKFAYVTLKGSKRPVMKKGFTMVKNGYPTVFGPWTDWNQWA